jgi:hypothetical protein
MRLTWGRLYSFFEAKLTNFDESRFFLGKAQKKLAPVTRSQFGDVGNSLPAKPWASRVNV